MVRPVASATSGTGGRTSPRVVWTNRPSATATATYGSATRPPARSSFCPSASVDRRATWAEAATSRNPVTQPVLMALPVE